jgi:hypothetical protein
MTRQAFQVGSRGAGTTAAQVAAMTSVAEQVLRRLDDAQRQTLQPETPA